MSSTARSHPLRLFMPLAFAAALLLPATASAQGTGAVTGRVTSSGQNPLSSVQVTVPGTGLGTLTDEDGRFRLEQVPTGEQQVRAQLVGYGTQTETVRVQAGQAASVTFRLQQEAIALDELVVTGTGTGGVARKKLGNTISSINTEELEDAPTQNFSQILQGRRAGVQVLPNGAQPGEGSSIQIRGSASLSQSNEPIVYVDGVRITRGGEFGGTVEAGTNAGVGATSRLDDIPPGSIERIEVLKGAAAATLYGTEASNGVIQIFTKSGREGSARWSFEVEQSAQTMPFDRVKPLADFARNEEQAQQVNQFWGKNVAPFEPFTTDALEMVDETGLSTDFSGSVNGGSEGITYFVSGRFLDQNGILGMQDLGPSPVDDLNQQLSGVANLNIFPADELRMQVRSSYTNTDKTAYQDGNNIFGVWFNMMQSQPRLANENNITGTPIFATVPEAMQLSVQQEVDHFSTSFQTTYSPTPSFNVHGTIGLDFTSNRSQEIWPFGWNINDFATSDTEGALDVNDETHAEITAEVRSGWETELGSDFTSSLTFGSQGFFSEIRNRGGSGQEFPAPGLDVASGGATQSVFESFQENVNIGVFAQEQIGYRDFAFLTVGARFDGNSAFGEEFSGVLYPKASFSVVPSDLSGWESGILSTFRIRGAVGQSGLQPGDFDQFRTFSAIASQTGSGLVPENLGNPELEPEVTTEWEAGAELGFFENRASLEVTYWDRTTSEALVSRQFPVSGGFRNRQLANIGEIAASGVDLSLEGRVVSSEDFSLNLFGNTAYLESTVTDLGGAPAIKAAGSYPRHRNFVREGFSPGAFFGTKLADMQFPLNIDGTCDAPSREELLAYFSQPRDPGSFEVIPQGVDDSCNGNFLDSHLGKPTPDFQGSFGADVSFLENFQLRTLFEYKAGDFRISDLSGAFRQSNAFIGRNTPAAARVEATLENPASSPEERLDAALEWARELRALAPMSGLNQIQPADFIRWRELSLSYDAPASFVQSLPVRTLSITASGRNLELWVNDAYTGIDPELNTASRCTGGGVDCNFLRGIEAYRLPIPRTFSLSVSTGF